MFGCVTLHTVFFTLVVYRAIVRSGSKAAPKIASDAIVCKEAALQGDVSIGSGTVVHPCCQIIAERTVVCAGKVRFHAARIGPAASSILAFRRYFRPFPQLRTDHTTALNLKVDRL